MPTGQHDAKRPKVDTKEQERCVNAIRCLGADMPSAANSGHPGAPMGCAPMAYLLWTEFMNYNPKNPKWFNRDRFVLSNGHGCALQYAMLYLAGYDLTIDDLRKFRQFDSKTPGHPENFMTPGIEVTTGPLGQGIANAVGFAIAERHFAAVYNTPEHKLIDNYVYVIMGDGCHQEGVSGEACSLAGHLGLGNLIVLYDDNKITIDGETELSFTEDVPKRFEAYGWQTLTVGHGDTDLTDLRTALQEAKAETGRPTLISVKTTIGFGSLKQGTEGVHGAPLKPDDLKQLKEKFGFDGNLSFNVPEDVLAVFRHAGEAGVQKEAEWNKLFADYKAKHPEKGAELERRSAGKLPEGWKNALPQWKAGDKDLATRQTSEIVLNALAPVLPELVGGSADLTPSNLTWLKCTHDFQKNKPDGRYIHFGVREHAMAAICNGLAAYGGLVPFGATFFNFIQYALGAVRLSALSHLGVLYVMTHDSIGLGEDGPTHQPINSLCLVRSMPNILGIRPADGNETSGAYAVAVENRHRPTVLVFTRQALPQLEHSSIEGVYKGGYVVHEVASPTVVLVASGSEVSLCISAAKELGNARVVSVPCMDLLDDQSLDYKKSLFPDGVPVISVEALGVTGWEKYSHVQIGMRTFGKSAPAKELFKYFGFTTENVVDKAKKTIEFYQGRHVPNLLDRPTF